MTTSERRCSVEACERKHKAKGFCERHYKVMNEPYRQREAARKKKWNSENQDYHKKWRAKNPDKSAAIYERHMKRRRERMQALPWAAQYIDAVNEFIRNTPAGYHTDHVVPLLGKNVCGFHVVWNLQYLPGPDNLKKGNKL